ncbi:MAG: hypothetical protein SPG09_09245 [Lachnospiraceae bacterium]|nr:hypothetical protein [bacterium]MDY5517777.1 hypothetical protein [Lachnospiraceae bacterium]
MGNTKVVVTENVLAVTSVSAVNATTLTVTGTKLGDLTATDITVAGNTVSSYTAAEDGKSATIVLGTALVPDSTTDVTINGTTFTVKYEASVLATSTDATTLNAVIENKDFVKFVYGGVTQIENDASTVKFIKADGSSKLGTNYVVKNVVVGVKVGANKYVQMTAPINRVFTSKNGDWS